MGNQTKCNFELKKIMVLLFVFLLLASSNFELSNSTSTEKSVSAYEQNNAFNLVTLDTSPIAGSIVINNGASYTNSNAVTLTLSATDSNSTVTMMRFSNNGINWFTWLPYSTTWLWSMANIEGNKTVYALFRAADDVVSPYYTASIILDTTAPTANAGQSQTATQGNSVTFNASASNDANGIVSYLWNFGDGKTGTGLTTSHVYSTIGNYVVTLTVKDPAENTATSTTNVTITAQPTPTPTSIILADYMVTAIAGIGGKIHPSGDMFTTPGTSYTFIITPNSGYKISDVTDNGVSKGAISTYPLNNVHENHQINATFQQISDKLTPTPTYITSTSTTTLTVTPTENSSLTDNNMIIIPAIIIVFILVALSVGTFWKSRRK